MRALFFGGGGELDHSITPVILRQYWDEWPRERALFN